MPGLAGCAGAGSTAQADDVLARLERMLATPYTTVATRHTGDCWVTLVRAGGGEAPDGALIDGVRVWVHGEAFGDRSIHDVVRAVSLGREQESALASLNGVFAAVAYVEQERRVLLVTDRLGLRHLYVRSIDRQLQWCSEQKGLLAMPGGGSAVADGSVRRALGVGERAFDGLWFDSARLLDAATVLSWRIGDESVSQRSYGGAPAAIDVPTDLDDLCGEMARRFEIAIQRRTADLETVGVTLSGGLDSRLILGAAIDSGRDVVSATSGVATSADQRIACRVANRAGSEHHAAYMDEHTWLTARLDMVWRTDGLLTIEHMHVLEAMQELSQRCAVSLDGFLGDVIAGGSSIRKSGPDVLARVLSSGRRHVMLGVILEEAFVRVRMPFADHEFLDFMLSVPVELRAKSRLYRRMLLMRSPALFEDIPTAAGPSVGSSKLITGLYGRWWRAFGAVRRMSRRVGSDIHDPRAPAPYATWLRRRPSRDIVSDLLAAPNTLLYDYMDKRDVAEALDRFLTGREGLEGVSRLLTTEAWLRACREEVA
jgi:asparagine synthase (glutamine-hydrolysing)